MAQIETWYNQDLQQPVRVHYLDGSLFSHNSNGNRIGVHVFNNGEPVTLTGTVSGYIVTADGSTVPCTGTRSGNSASILIPAAAYQPGAVFITLFITDGTTVTTLASVSTNVLTARTNNQIDPGSVVTDWTQTINTAMQSVETAAENLGGIIAVPYANITYPVPLGKYTYYEGNLYRCISPIATSESFTAAHWTQVRLGDDVSDLNSAIGAIELTFTDGGFVNQSNYISSNENYSYSNYIDVIPGEKIRLLSYFSGDAKAVFCGETKTDVKQYISSSQNLYDNIITVPADARYFRFSCISVYKSRAYAIRISADEFELYNDFYHNTVADLNNLNANVDDIKGIVDFSEIELTFNNDFYVNMNGQKATGWGGHSQFIELKAGETIRAYLRGSGTVVALIAISKSTTSTTFTPVLVSQNSNPVTVEYIATEDCYAILSSNYTAIAPKAWKFIDFAELNDRVSALENKGAPLDEIIKSGGALALFSSVGCIGDSLSVGETYSNQGGSWQVHSPNYPISWPQRLAQMDNINAYNFGRGGQTSKTWLAEWANNTEFTSHVCDAYIIALGVNDSQTYDPSTTIPVGQQSDIGTQNETFYRYYGDIISRIKQLQPKAKIFVVTMPTGLATRGAYNVAIRYMATAFSNVYVIDLEQYASLYSQLTGSTAYWRNGHGNAMMYQISAWHINSYIDWIVHNYPNEFNQVEYIGTEYSYNQ